MAQNYEPEEWWKLAIVYLLPVGGAMFAVNEILDLGNLSEGQEDRLLSLESLSIFLCSWGIAKLGQFSLKSFVSNWFVETFWGMSLFMTSSGLLGSCVGAVIFKLCRLLRIF